jgi:superfamily II DNA or RNA helicase
MPMHEIPIHIDHKLHARVSDLPEAALADIVDVLSIPNLAREKARKQDQWGWELMPPRIFLYTLADGELTMPRGFLESLALGLEVYGLAPRLVEGRHWKQMFRIGHEIELLPWQAPQVESIRRWEQGILKAPAGSGKTVTVLATIQRLACNSLVIVNTKDILWQWQERARQFLGPDYPVGQIGDNVFEISPYLTIATAQTLHRRFGALAADGFFDAFSFVCLDECHHATAETFNRIVNRFSARYRLGVSATPDKTGDFTLATHVLGPIIHATPPGEVENLQAPVVVRVPTQFTFRFRGHKNRYQRSNYPQMVEAIVRDPARNLLIVQTILANLGHHQLVVTKRLEHIQILEDILADELPASEVLLKLTGTDSNEARDEAVETIGRCPGVLLSTLADEALDIPRLDRIHLVFPQRNPGLVTQQIGRVERRHPDKTDAVIFDYVDGQVGPLEAQWRTRKLEVYMLRNYRIEVLRKI